MKVNDFFLAGYREWYWFLVAGKPVRKGNIFTLLNNNFKELPEPIFFLSTGRTGTKWFAHLFKKQKDLMTFHQAIPSLAIQNKFYYEIINSSLNEKLKYEIGKEIFLAAREEYLVYSYKTQKKILETNNDLLFFANVIAKLIPHSKFVHIYRHPGDFVRSGLARSWYKEDEVAAKMIEIKKIENWDNLSRIEKIAWLWKESNLFIENFKKSINEERVFMLDFTNLSIEKIIELSKFVGTKLNEKKIQKMKNKKINTQKNYYPKYENWNNEDKNKIKNICGDLALHYGYKL